MISLATTILILIALAAVVMGVFLFVKPHATLAIQKRFYEKINWRIEPVSLTREVRNTKIMGLLLLGISLGAIIYKIMAK
jgi:hypothetical protein